MKFKKIVELKSKNKRFTVAWLEDNTVFFQTKILQDWKKRIITMKNGIYSIESFILLAELFDFIYSDADFKKENNATFEKVQKDNNTAKVLDAINQPHKTTSK